MRVHHSIAPIHPYSFKNIAPNGDRFHYSLIRFFRNDLKNNEDYIYLCSPLAATSDKSGKDHIVESIKAASEIAGSEFEGKKLVLWLPHLHAFSMFNEFVNPALRPHGVKFTSYFIKKTKPIIAILEGRISQGMEGEIEIAKKLNLAAMRISQLKKLLKNLPAKNEAKKISDILINLYPKDFLNHPELNKKKL